MSKLQASYDTTVFKKSLEEFGIILSEKQIEQFLIYYEILMEKNKVMNLTAITEYEEVVKKHFVDSLALVKAYELTGRKKVLDLGTGAGFPGIPLKIAFPNLEITLLDSLNKRINFLWDVIEELELDGIEAVHGRAEDLANKFDYREKYDLVVSRAVANLSTLSEYCLPFVKVGGFFIPYKSEKLSEELGQAKNAVKLLGGEVSGEISFNLPHSDISRNFVKILKKKPTHAKYPRKAGLPSKEPLV